MLDNPAWIRSDAWWAVALKARNSISLTDFELQDYVRLVCAPLHVVEE